MPALIYNRVNSVIIKNVIILNIINNFFLFKKNNHFSMRGFLFRTARHNKTEGKKIKVTLKTNNFNQVFKK